MYIKNAELNFCNIEERISELDHSICCIIDFMQVFFQFFIGKYVRKYPMQGAFPLGKITLSALSLFLLFVFCVEAFQLGLIFY